MTTTTLKNEPNNDYKWLIVSAIALFLLACGMQCGESNF